MTALALVATASPAAAAATAALHGTVTVSGSATPAPAVTVRLHNGYGAVTRSTSSAPDGTWAMSGIGTGTWAISFVAPDGTLAPTYWPGAPTFAGATKLALRDGEDRRVDQALDRTGSLTGRVTLGWGPGAPMAAVVIDAQERIAGWADAGADGTWRVDRLAPGGYKVGYLDRNPAATHRLRSEIVPDLDAEADQDAALAAGQVFTLPPGGVVATGTERVAGLGCDPARFHPGVRVQVADLRNLDLRGCDLTRANLWGSNLTGSDLTHARISGADLRRTTGLTAGQLTATDHAWATARLSQTGVDLTGTNFSVGDYVLWGTDLRGLALNDAGLSGVDLRGADLRDTDLSGARFAKLVVSCLSWTTFCAEYDRSADTAGTKVAGADLTDAVLTARQIRNLAPDWRGTDFSGTQGLEVAPASGLVSGGGDSVTFTTCACTGVTTDRPAGLGTYPGLFTPADLRANTLAGARFAPSNGTDVGFDFAGAALAGVDGHDLACPSCTFAGADLRGIDLTGADLTAADFTGADLTGATLDGAELDHATFFGTTLTGASLAGVSIDGLDLASTVGLTGTQLDSTGPDWRWTKLPPVDLRGRDLRGRLLRGTGLADVDLTGSRITGVDLEGATGLTGLQLRATDPDWRGTRLRGTRVDLHGTDLAGGGFLLSGADLADADLSGTTWTGIDVSGLRIDGANLRGAVGLSWGAHFVGADLSDTVLAGVDLRGADLSRAELYGADLTGADLTGVRLTDARLDSAVLHGTVLTRAVTTGAVVERADFTDAVGLTRGQLVWTRHQWTGIRLAGTGVNLSGIDFHVGLYTLNEADLRGVNLAGAGFTGVQLFRARLDGADLTGARISGAFLQQVTVDGAALASTDHDWTNTNLDGVTASMAGVDFAAGGYRLQGATLASLDLTGASFVGLDLTATSFASRMGRSAATLHGADLRQAILDRSDLRGVDLGAAVLRLARLTAASLAGADLRGTDFTGATGSGTGGATATYGSTTCPDGTVADGTTVLTCVGHGIGS